jgi:hypothetical protein
VLGGEGCIEELCGFLYFLKIVYEFFEEKDKSYINRLRNPSLTAHYQRASRDLKVTSAALPSFCTSLSGLPSASGACQSSSQLQGGGLCKLLPQSEIWFFSSLFSQFTYPILRMSSERAMSQSPAFTLLVEFLIAVLDFHACYLCLPFLSSSCYFP